MAFRDEVLVTLSILCLHEGPAWAKILQEFVNLKLCIYNQRDPEKPPTSANNAVILTFLSVTWYRWRLLVARKAQLKD